MMTNNYHPNFSISILHFKHLVEYFLAINVVFVFIEIKHIININFFAYVVEFLNIFIQSLKFDT